MMTTDDDIRWTVVYNGREMDSETFLCDECEEEYDYESETVEQAALKVANVVIYGVLAIVAIPLVALALAASRWILGV